MAIIKEARITVSSIIENLDDAGLAHGDIERTSCECSGYYNYSDGRVEITYSEQTDGGEVTTTVAREGDAVRVVRHGAIESDMLFTKGVAHTSEYAIPPYRFDCSVMTRRIRDSLDECGGGLDLLYNMSIGGADKAVRMKIWISTDTDRA
jgi:uncharacterized beta-barrel protein YwiB (DUF1934 family)